MSKRRAMGVDLVKLWLAALFVIGASIWVLSQSTVNCPTSIVDSAGMGRCIGTSFAHAFAPAAPWAIAFAGALAAIATLIFALRRR